MIIQVSHSDADLVLNAKKIWQFLEDQNKNKKGEIAWLTGIK